MPPTLGVLITYYNEGPLLTECLDTLLSGPDRPDEILIYDDASQDPAEAYVKKEHPVRIIRGTENVGIGRARNELMKASQSDFIHFQDADDYFDTKWCASVRDVISRSEADIILNNIFLVKAQSPEVPAVPLYKFKFQTSLMKDDLLEFFLSRTTIIFVLMTTYRRTAGLRAGGFLPREVLNLGEDFEFHLRLFGLGLQVEVIQDYLAIRRRRPNSLSHDENVKLRWGAHTDLIRSLYLIAQWLPNRYYPHVMVRLFQEGIPLAYPGNIQYTKEAFQLAQTLGLIGCKGKRRDTYPQVIAKRLLQNGILLFRAGEIDYAKRAFREARHYGPVRWNKGSNLYRLIFRLLGPESAEWAVYFYSRLVPIKLRAIVRSRLK